MRCTFLTLGLLCLSEQVSQVAAKNALRSPDLLWHEHSLSSKLRRRAEAAIYGREASPKPLPVAQAQAPSAVSSSPASVAGGPSNTAASVQPSETLFGSIDPNDPLTPTTEETEATCLERLKALKGQPSNPTGMSTCYNVAGFNNVTGCFEANVLVYMIGVGQGVWADIDPAMNMVSLEYGAASFRPVIPGTANGTQKRDATETVKLVARQAADPVLQGAPLTFEGKIRGSELEAHFDNFTEMRFALTPKVILSSRTRTGEAISATMNNQDAAFVNGYFSDDFIAAAQAAATPFVLPGTTLGIFPTGLIITSIWAFLFLGAVGFGTLGRINYRKAYRRRTGNGAYGYETGAAKRAAYDKR